MIRKQLLNGALAAILALPGGVVLADNAEIAGRESEEALAKTPDTENGRKVYTICTVCHSPEGWGGANGVYPQIAGQHRSVVIKQLADIRARNRDNPTMRPFAVPQLMGGAQEMADVAAYIEQLPMTPQNGVGSGRDLAHGERLYKDNCVECHGERGEGNAAEHVPLIQGQHYRYLVRQFDWIRIGKRRNADPKMVKQIRGFSGRDVAAVMDYVSRIQPPAERLGKPGWHNPDFPKYYRGYTPEQYLRR
ncbi:MAG: c-type cytochrome [Candidatus Sedimenticola endophacoides]